MIPGVRDDVATGLNAGREAGVLWHRQRDRWPKPSERGPLQDDAEPQASNIH